MKPSRTSHYVSVCLNLVFAYALLISNIAPFAANRTQAATVKQGAPVYGKNSPPNHVQEVNGSATQVSFAQTSTQANSRDGEVLVKFRAGASDNDKNVVALTHSAQRKKLRGESGVEKLRARAGQSSESLALALLQQPEVEFAEPNFLIKPDQTGSGSVSAPDDTQFNEQWALRNTGQDAGQYGSDIGVTAAWQTTTGLQSTVIAVIDSGIDFSHPDLTNNQWTNPAPSADGDIHGWDYIADNGAIKDEQGHGTAIAGIIAAQGNNSTGISGVMWKASLMSLRVLDNTGTGDIGDAIEAIDYAVSHGAQVINISWGTSGDSLILKDAIERAMARGLVVVCSAGNGSQNIDATPYYPASFGLRDMITVAATDNFDRLTPWSNWGTDNVTIAAPGIDVLTTKMGGGYSKVTGTSAAAPLVTGVVGLIKSTQPRLNSNRVAKAIQDEARKVASLNGKVATGGVVNAAGSLGSLQGSSNQPPHTPTPGYGTGGTGPGGTFTTNPPTRTTEVSGSNLPNLDQARNSRQVEPRTRQPIQSNLMCADCDPLGGGGGGSYYPAGDPNFSSARQLPTNETGEQGVDLGSRNFNWSTPLVSLPGRAGMDVSLSLSYNSLVWTRDGSDIKYNADFGTPAPGFRLGLPKLQQRFQSSRTGGYSYMMVTPSGRRVELRQVGQSSIYESQDGSYTQLDVTNLNAPVVRTNDGTRLSFGASTVNNEHRCVEVKDRNGNIISATYDSTTGHLQTLTDTLGRILSFNYTTSGNLETITQTWGGSAREWARFEYGEVYVSPNFSGLNVNGPSTGYVTVLTKVELLDDSSFTFNYNAAFGQVNRINHHAADGHVRSYTSYNVSSNSGQTDCPRFTERKDWAERWNDSAEVVTYYSAAVDNSWSQQQTTLTGPTYKEFYATSGWQTGLTTGTEVWSGGVKQKWTTVAWSQDDPNLSYQKNPRVTETNIYDAGQNRKRVTIDYGAVNGPYWQWSLPYLVKEYAADGTELRHTYTDYNLSQSYLDRRIIGLVSARHISDTVAWKSIIYFGYDESGLTATPYTTIRHDVSFNTSHTARGNLTSVTRYDVEAIGDSSKRAVTTLGYDTNGSTVWTRDPMGHQTSIGYTDSFSATPTDRYTYAYPTIATITDPGNYSSTTQYDYDLGVVSRSQDPKGSAQRMIYDSAARIQRVTAEADGGDKGYQRWIYDLDGSVKSYQTIQEGAGETFSIAVFDGHGRTYMSAAATPVSVGGYTAQSFRYDEMGRLKSQSNPTEVNWAWTPAGDDAGGWSWTNQSYDWKGRPVRTTNSDGTYRESTYGGCGCAGGEVTTVRDERGRGKKLTMDVVGRLKQVDELNWNQSVYATTSYGYNALNQITSSNQAGQSRTFEYDGHGRLRKKTTPEQGLTEYSYNLDDTVSSVKDARQVTTGFSYNNRHLITGITFNVNGDTTGQTGITPNVTFTYDAAGNRLEMDDGPGKVTYTYNTMSQLTSEGREFDGVTGSFGISYAYNLGGQLKSVTGPSQFGNVKVNYDYDTIGRVTGVTGDNYASGMDYVNSLSYRAFGLKGMSYTNGKNLALKYDNRMRPTEWHVPAVMKWDYSYTNFGENTGRVTYAKNLEDGTLDRSYDYDQVGRLVAAHSGQEARWHIGTAAWAIDGPYSQLSGYDQFGNRTHREGWGGSYGASNINENFTYSNNKQVGLSYDAAGNYTAGGAIIYDATGQQINSGGAVSNAYDGDRLRAKKVDNGTTTYYLRSSVLGGQVVAELSSTGAWTRGFVYLGGQLVALQGGSGGTVSWVHQDPVTKSQRVTNSSGAVVSTIDLDPFGGETARSAQSAFQPRKYTTYERDNNGTDDAMHRRFDAIASRFAQPDPYDGSYDLADPQSFNRYAYVQNDPVNFVDPTGLLPSAGCTAENSFTDCYGSGGGFWGGGYSGGNGWGSDPRPGLAVLGRSDYELHPREVRDGDDWVNYQFGSVLIGFGYWSGYFGITRGGSPDPEKPDPDPCAGVKPNDLNYSRVRKYKRGGMQSAEQHIRQRHMSGNILKASQYFATFNMVKSYNRLTFLLGDRYSLGDGSIIFQLELPFPTGIDYVDKTKSTGWNLLRLEKDCLTVDSSYPGTIR